MKSVFKCIVAVVLVTACFNAARQQKLRIITWDNFGYYLHLPAVLKYHDCKNYAFADSLRSTYHASPSLYQLTKTGDGRLTPTYTIGMAICYLPGYFIGDLIARILGSPRDGMSPPYQWALLLVALTMASAALLLLYQVFSGYLRNSYRLLLLTGLMLGTNFLYYFVFETITPHIVLFSLYTFLITATIRFRRKPTAVNASGIILCATLLALARPSEILSFVLPISYLTIADPTYILRHRKIFLPGIAIAILLVLLQIGLWWYTTGHFFFNPYPFHLELLKPHVFHGLFSFRKGWILYTPFFLLWFIGFLIPEKYWLKGWKLPVLLFSILQIWIVFAWPMWWYASSFGMRALIQCYPFFLLSVAAVFNFIEKQKNTWLSLLLLVFVIACIFLNLFQTYQYTKRILPLDGNTSTYYKHVFFHTEFDRKALKYLDMDGDVPPLQLISKYQYNDTMMELPHGVFSTEKKIILPKSEKLWVVCEVEAAQESVHFGEYDFTKMVVEIKRGDSTLFWKSFHLQRLLNEKGSTVVVLPFHFENLVIGDQLKCYCWNNGPDTVHFRIKSICISVPKD
ncbi:MAG: hypothetical protein U0T73_00450 [Chitinophagales bacterium]